jgi:hypothetical protein
MFFRVGSRPSPPSLSPPPPLQFSCPCRCWQHSPKCKQDKAYRCSQCYPLPCGDFSSMTAFCLPLFSLNSLRVCAGAAPVLFVLGGGSSYGQSPSSFVAETETIQQASAHPCSPGWDSGHPLPPSISPPHRFSSSCRYSISLSCLNAPQVARMHRVALEAEDAVTASERRYAPSISTCLASRKQKRFTNAPLRHGQ